MSEATRSASPYLDEPWRRLAWIAPLAIVLWAITLTAFALLLEQTAPPPEAIKPLTARIVELPPSAGLQGGPAAKPATPMPAMRKPHLEVKHKAAPIPHPAKPLPEVPPSAFGTAKSAAATQPAAPAKASAIENPGIPGGNGTGSGSGLGSDTAGARALYAPTPTISDDLREDALDAVAVAHFKVGYDGQVDVALVKPTSNPELNQLLLDTLKHWRFFPAMRNGVAIPSEFDVRIPISVQ